MTQQREASVVIDASVAVALVHREEASALAHRMVAAWRRERITLVAPDLLWLEVVNVLGHRYRYRGSEILEAIHELDALDISSASIDRPLLLASIDALERFGLSAYDAAYVALADAEDAPIATSDRALAWAAGERAILLDETAGAQSSETHRQYGAEPTWPTWPGAGAYLAKLRAETSASRQPKD